MADLATRLRPLERLAQEVRDAPPTDEIGWLARDVVSHAQDVDLCVSQGRIEDAASYADEVALAARELDLALVVLAPVDDPHHPAWDLLLRWRDAVAKAEV